MWKISNEKPKIAKEWMDELEEKYGADFGYNYDKGEKPSKTTRSKTISKKGYSNIMKARSDMTYENGKYKVDTKMNVNKKINAKEKRTLIVNIIKQLNNLFDDYEFVFNEKI